MNVDSRGRAVDTFSIRVDVVNDLFERLLSCIALRKKDGHKKQGDPGVKIHPEIDNL